MLPFEILYILYFNYISTYGSTSSVKFVLISNARSWTESLLSFFRNAGRARGIVGIDRTGTALRGTRYPFASIFSSCPLVLLLLVVVIYVVVLLLLMTVRVPLRKNNSIARRRMMMTRLNDKDSFILLDYRHDDNPRS
jgi:preprotein translocase subunit SecY